MSQHFATAGSSWAAGGSIQGSLELWGHSQAPPAALTYEPYYGLKEKPFSLSSDPRFLYRSTAHTHAFEELLTGIRRREGLIVLTGEIGTGKTTLMRAVLQQLDRRTFTAFVPDPFVSREDLLKMLLVDFGVISRSELRRGSLVGASRPELSYPLYEFLDSLVPLQAFAVVIIDEAQNLPLPLLEEIRILSDLEQREKLLQVVLVGQPELRSHLKLPEMRQVDQRVSVRCELPALSLGDVGTYIRHRLEVASAADCRVEFSEAAISAVYAASSGIPRVINLICDKTLQRGHRLRAPRVDAALVVGAAAALGIEAAMPDDSATSTASADAISTATLETVDLTSASPGGELLAPQILSEFAAESDLLAQPTSHGGSRFVVWAAAAATAFVSSVAVASLYFAMQPLDITAQLPRRAAWRLEPTPFATPAPTPTPAVHPVEVPDQLPVRPAWQPAPSPVDGPLLVPPASQAESPQSRADASLASAPTALYAIQVASFESRARADRLVQELTQAGFQARSVEFDLGPPRGVVLQIRVDGYSSLADADADLARIRQMPGYADAHLLSN